MLELGADEFARAVKVFQGMSHCVPPFAVIEGNNPGRVFVDDASAPTVAFIWSRWGYYYLAGDVHNEAVNRSLARLLSEELIPQSVALGERWPVLYPYPEAWREKIDVLLGGRAVQRLYRRTYTFNPSRFARLPDWRERVPAGFSMRRIDEELIAATGDELAGGIKGTWSSIDHFLSKGLGYCLLHEGRVASLCLACLAGLGRLEIGISTAEAYRRQGLATLTASAFIKDCLQKGLQPNWECWWTNTASAALAEKLGFEQGVDFPVYHWEERLT
jgi:RimJ/RimL family protein N-acetyltransferase